MRCMWCCMMYVDRFTGCRDLSGPRTFARDLDLEYESPRPRTQAPNSHHGSGLHHEDDEDTVYDIRGQRTNRRNMAETFGSEVAATTRRFKAQAASISYDAENYTDLRRSVQQQQQRRHQDIEEKFVENARTAMEDADAAFKRRSKLITESDGERNAAMTRWAKLPDLDTEININAATRAKQTKARLENLESEMEEMAERQAKRERRAAALRAFVDENSSTDDFTIEKSSKKVAIRSTERADKHVTF
ncbi:hypothetical protein PV325_009120 [Microctonus aethiopoides]|nr:hypothetical protein PV325_009120 [Microctonus aethiopoides]